MFLIAFYCRTLDRFLNIVFVNSTVNVRLFIHVYFRSVRYFDIAAVCQYKHAYTRINVQNDPRYILAGRHAT